ncbi:hypothetical protein HN358_05010 [Candidatus Uhrbacteria bacterium]|jgi:hypothetical protein|nr:hypothetical protein [Candidatus Uhrbacteria bacterium]MBT7716776.1 hypothetical protein [Candidatus Uhrbacteria bacterium]
MSFNNPYDHSSYSRRPNQTTLFFEGALNPSDDMLEALERNGIKVTRFFRPAIRHNRIRYHNIEIIAHHWLYGDDVRHELGFPCIPMVQLRDGTWLKLNIYSGAACVCDPNEELRAWYMRRRALCKAGGQIKLPDYHEPPPLVREQQSVVCTP